MSNDVFGQLSVFMFVTIPTGSSVSRDKRVKLATIHCRRSECDEHFENFKANNDGIARKVHAEFSFREMV
jgi:hypothetical protein